MSYVNPMRVRFQLKYVWYVFLAVLGVLSFFGIWNPPKTWETFLNSVAPFESWWTAHFADPLLAAFVSGLLLSTVFLPEILRLVRRHMFPETPRPDVDGATLFNEIFAKSRRAKELVSKNLLKT